MTKEEAINRIKAWNLETDEWEVLATIIPELVESEDEKIRKEIIEFIEWADARGSVRNDWHQAKRPYEWIAYLEKQKEQMPIPDKFSGLKSLMLQYLQSAANRKDDIEIESDTDLWGRKILDYVWKYSDTEKQKEQKPVECIKFDNEFENQISHLIASVLNGEHEYSEGFVKYVAQSLLGYAKNEQIPYTDFVIKPHKGDDNNPYDMSASEAQEYAIKRGFGIPFIDGEVYVDERHIIQTIGNIIRWADEHPKEQKPSEEQMEALESAVKLLNKINSL